LLWGFPGSLVAQKMLSAGRRALEAACRAITGLASTDKRTAAMPIRLNFVIALLLLDRNAQQSASARIPLSVPDI
jgi:hypothetical protein